MARFPGGTIVCFATCLLLGLGCEPRLPEIPSNSAPTPVSIGTRFDPATAGKLWGQVTWEGPNPVVAPIEVWSIPQAEDGSREKRLEPNPNAPVINAGTRALRNAVVFLRGVDAYRSRPWDLPPVRVELRERQFHVMQGSADRRVGFVRQGDRIEIVSRDSIFHAVHAHGAAFFARTFPDPDSPCRCVVENQGIVELSSAAGYLAMRAHLFVVNHPYFALTDRDGRFAFEQVPPGEYDVVVWHPNWVIDYHERDPETAVICRLHFRSALHQVKRVTIAPHSREQIRLTLNVSAAR